MKRVLAGGVGFGLLAALSLAWAQNWAPSYEEARKASAESGRPLLLVFSHRDWWWTCSQFKAATLDQPQFAAFARTNLTLLSVEGSAAGAKGRLGGMDLVKKYGVRVYPTVVLVGPDGKVLTMVDYPPGGVPGLISNIKPFLGAAPGGVPAGTNAPPRRGAVVLDLTTGKMSGQTNAGAGGAQVLDLDKLRAGGK